MDPTIDPLHNNGLRRNAENSSVNDKARRNRTELATVRSDESFKAEFSNCSQSANCVAGLTYLRIKVTPKSAKNELTGILDDGTIKIRIAAPPEKGKANKELIKFLSAHYNVPKAAISIISGKSDPLKLIKINAS